jgi:hypothetical protein
MNALNLKNFESVPDQNIDLPQSFFIENTLFLIPILESENIDLPLFSNLMLSSKNVVKGL